ILHCLLRCLALDPACTELLLDQSWPVPLARTFLCKYSCKRLVIEEPLLFELLCNLLGGGLEELSLAQRAGQLEACPGPQRQQPPGGFAAAQDLVLPQRRLQAVVVKSPAGKEAMTHHDFHVEDERFAILQFER